MNVDGMASLSVMEQSYIGLDDLTEYDGYRPAVDPVLLSHFPQMLQGPVPERENPSGRAQTYVGLDGAGRILDPTSSRPIHVNGSTSQPSDLSNLKARALASITRVRAERSATPSSERVAVNTPKALAEALTDSRKDSRTDHFNANAQRKDSRTDIEGLLAEGKAAAEANKESSKANSMSLEREKNAAKEYNSHTVQESPRRGEAAIPTKRPAPKSEPSEQGEICEDDDDHLGRNRKQQLAVSSRASNSQYSAEATTARPKQEETTRYRQPLQENNKPRLLMAREDVRLPSKRYSTTEHSSDQYDSKLSLPSIEMGRALQPRPENMASPTDIVARASDVKGVGSQLQMETQPSMTTSEALRSYWVNLDEWLDITGFHDLTYQNQVLKRHRELTALELRKATLEREAQAAIEERASYARAQSVRRHETLDRTLPHSSSPDLRSSNTRPEQSMPPPSSIRDVDERSTRHGHAMSQAAPLSHTDREKVPKTYHHHSHDQEVSPRTIGSSEVLDSSGGRLKRRYQEDADSAELENTRKMTRTQMPDDRARSTRRDYSPQAEKSQFRKMSYTRADEDYGRQRRASDDRTRLSHYNRTDNDDYHPQRRHSQFHEHDDRSHGFRDDFPRRDSRRQRLDLKNSVCRFFVIKSFNVANVEQAQEEGVWVTQEKNSNLFKEAFETCDHVILVFSINKSTAFQGYARMESAPGTAEIPRWASVLLWEFSGPFRIRWVTIAETKFHRVGHLKNPYNDDLAVLVARDGQEIEPRVGAALCDLIDEEADRSSRWVE
ncbi:MAG: hypothetical protein M1833_004505 [Piccolia ochrophora]|nr:MAG: hypothetical protein M1833_004505 [Piccolia ochrophora]